MNILNNMPIGRKLACGFRIMLILTVALGVVAYREVGNMALYADIQGEADNVQESMITVRQQDIANRLMDELNRFKIEESEAEGGIK